MRAGTTLMGGRLPERTNGAASKAVVAFGLPRVRIPHLPLDTEGRRKAVLRPFSRRNESPRQEFSFLSLFAAHCSAL